ncbi:MAG TPA: tRNA (adenosine(37)-N6)-threonylcarbamoyltransferase complex transferase subunit TsaD [Spirochaetota bacterium]|nr:tRNA (adenosine(37)-N6)-threonylcarbamoyltransferase complex transferase subunit TsaD [Spirochaetota bacterium]
MSAKKRDTLGLGLESSCDETSVSVVRNGREILSNLIFSQIALHREYFGVVPEIASRAHLETVNGLVDGALREAGISFKGLGYVAATQRPGLTGSLLIALQSAKAVSYAMNIPMIAVNHLEAHLYAPFLEGREPEYPYIGLLVSGGNTALYHVRGIADFTLIGKTVDDAVGEAFDKVAKLLDLGYPGGPVVESLARTAVLKKKLFPKILPDPNGDYRFSYSGLKTAVVQYRRVNPLADRAELVHAFQERALEILVRRVFAASREFGIPRIVVAGGVAANGRLREMLAGAREEGEEVIIASPVLCTDNAAMVAGLGYHYFRQGLYSPLDIDVSARV